MSFNIQQNNELPTPKSFTILIGDDFKQTYFDYFAGIFNGIDEKNNLLFEFDTIHYEGSEPIFTKILSLTMPVSEVNFSEEVLNKINQLKKGFNPFNCSIALDFDGQEKLERDLRNTFAKNLSLFFGDDDLDISYDVCLKGFECNNKYNIEGLAIKLSLYMLNCIKNSF